ncbi:MAG: hypothetical protein RJB11_3072 [Planctomycetota bacterium]|jgi:hypothetical protein
MTLFVSALVLAFLVLAGIVWLAFGPPSASFGTMQPRTSDPIASIAVTDSAVLDASSHTFADGAPRLANLMLSVHAPEENQYIAGRKGYAEHVRTRIDSSHLNLGGTISSGPHCAHGGHSPTSMRSV